MCDRFFKSETAFLESETGFLYEKIMTKKNGDSTLSILNRFLPLIPSLQFSLSLPSNLPPKSPPAAETGQLIIHIADLCQALNTSISDHYPSPPVCTKGRLQSGCYSLLTISNMPIAYILYIYLYYIYTYIFYIYCTAQVITTCRYDKRER